MKTLRTFICLLFILITIPSLTQNYSSKWVTPLPQGNTLNSVHFFTITNGFVVGEAGTILKTLDGGKSWSIVNSGTLENLRKIIFVNNTNGFVIGEKGLLMSTTDGGNNWTSNHLNTSSKLVDMHFSNPTTGYILTERTDLFQTVDGGRSWTKITLPSRQKLMAIDFATTSFGAIVTQRNEIMLTLDGSKTWKLIDLKTNANSAIRRAYFTDVQYVGNKIILSSQKNIFISEDKGATWINQVVNSKAGYIQSMNFLNSKLAFLTDANGNLLKSKTDINEFDLKLNKEQLTKLKEVFMLNMQYGFAVGESGRVFSTRNGGESWNLLTTGATYNFKDIEYINQNVGYLLTDDGKIYKTMDGGRNISLVTDRVMKSGFTNSFIDLHFIDPQKGFASSSMGYLCSTKDGGRTWSQIKVQESKLTGFEFVDKSTGFIGSKNGVIYKTVNGGISWDKIITGIKTNIYDIDFANNNVGFAAGDKGVALKTVDGGKTWTQIQTILKNNLMVVHAIDERTVLFGTTGNYTKMADAEIIRSTDGGASWNKMNIEPYSIFKFDFYDNKVGAALCSGGAIAITVDGGVTWTTNKSIGNIALWGIHWSNKDNMLVAGNSGAILNYSKGQTIIANNKNRHTNVLNNNRNRVNNQNNNRNNDVVKNENNTEAKTIKRVLNEVDVEFTSIKKEKRKKSGVLKNDLNLNIGPNTIPFAAGSKVEFDSAKSVITKAIVKKDTEIKVNGGSLILKANTPVEMDGKVVLTAVMKENTELINLTGKIPVKAMETGSKPNIAFNRNGDFIYAFLSKPFNVDLDENSIEIPEGSKLDFSNGLISGCSLSKNIKLNLGGKTYEVQGTPAASLNSFNTSGSTGVFSSIRVTEGHTVFANEMEIPVKGGSNIILNKKSGTYKVRKFDLGQAMLLNIYKKRKTKQKDVKFGKTLVVEDGYIIRVGL